MTSSPVSLLILLRCENIIMKELLNSGRDNRVIITLQNENVIRWESMHKWLHILLLCHLLRWIFKLPHHLHVHLIVFAKSAYCNSTDEGPGLKRLERNSKHKMAICSLFFVEHSLTYFTKCHAAYQNFFSRYLLDHLLYRLQLCWGMVWTLHHFCSVYSHFSQDEYLWDWP